MDFDLALECVDPTTRRGDGEHAWTPARAACKLCGDEQSDPRDAPCCGATVCAACIVSSAAAGATGELRCPSCNSDGDYYVAYAASYGAQRPVRPPAEPREDGEVARLRRELAEAKAGLKRAERETTQLRRELDARPAKRRRAAPAAPGWLRVGAHVQRRDNAPRVRGIVKHVGQSHVVLSTATGEVRIRTDDTRRATLTAEEVKRCEPSPVDSYEWADPAAALPTVPTVPFFRVDIRRACADVVPMLPRDKREAFSSLMRRLASLKTAGEIPSLTEALALHVPAVVGADLWYRACESQRRPTATLTPPQSRSPGVLSRSPAGVLRVGSAARDLVTGAACKVVDRNTTGLGWWTIELPGERPVEFRRQNRRTDQLEVLECAGRVRTVSGSSLDSASAGAEASAPAAARPAISERRARVFRCFEHAVTCGGCDGPECAAMKQHIQHHRETKGECRCNVCRGVATCIILHSGNCRSTTCPLPGCSQVRRRLHALAGTAERAPNAPPPPRETARPTVPTQSPPPSAPAPAARAEPAPAGSSAPAWYVEEQHLQERRRTVTNIARALQAAKRDVSAEWMQKLPRIARRLEESLFRSALSFEEYSDRGTLRKRLQALAKAMRLHAQQQKQNVDETESGDETEPGAFKVIDPAGAELRSSSDDNDSKKVRHLASGTVVVVDFVKKRLVSTPRACIVERGRFVGWVDLDALARIGDDRAAGRPAPPKRYGVGRQTSQPAAPFMPPPSSAFAPEQSKQNRARATSEYFWTPDEDVALRRLHAEHSETSSKWDVIAAAIGTGRTASAAERRWGLIKNTPAPPVAPVETTVEATVVATPGLRHGLRPSPPPPLAEDVDSLIARNAPIRRTTKRRRAAPERYTTATSAREYLGMGGLRSDLQYDIDSGYFEVTDRLGGQLLRSPAPRRGLAPRWKPEEEAALKRLVGEHVVDFQRALDGVVPLLTPDKSVALRSLLLRLKSLREANEISSVTQALAEHVPAVVGLDVWHQACEGVPKNWDAIAAALGTGRSAHAVEGRWGKLEAAEQAAAQRLRGFEHAATCRGCDSSSCASVRAHVVHFRASNGTCRCEVCQAFAKLVAQHALTCRRETCPIPGCARARGLAASMPTTPPPRETATTAQLAMRAAAIRTWRTAPQQPAPEFVLPPAPPPRETAPTTQAAVPSVPPPPVASAEQAAPPAPPPAEPGSRDLFDESSDEEDATCAICLEPLGDAPRMPGCAHRFHAACVLGPDSLASHAWADGVMPSTRRGQRVLCPLCRAPSLIPPGFL